MHGLTRAELLADTQLRTALQQHIAEFGNDVKSYDDVAKLSPDRQQRFVQNDQALRTAFGQYQQLQTQRQLTQNQIAAARAAEQAQSFKQYQQEQNEIVAKSIPEITGDPQTAYTFRAAVAEILKEVGITEDAYRSFAPDVRRAMHAAEFQRLVADATRYRQGKARAAEVSALPLPPVQRPGVARDRGDRASADLSRLDQRIDNARPGSDRQLRAAAALVAAKRRGR